MAIQNQVGTHKTTIYTEDEMTKVKYWYTDVVSFNHKEIILDTGGHWSNTTKTRMNQASVQYGLGYRVYQKNWDWFVEYNNKTIEFESDGLVLERN